MLTITDKLLQARSLVWLPFSLLMFAAVACGGDEADATSTPSTGVLVAVSPTATPATSPEPAATSTPPTGAAGDSDGDAEDTPTPEPETDLNGLWEDGGREVRITQSGNSVTATYVEPHTCDHDDGTGQTSQTDLDFEATLEGNTLTGNLQVCGFGESNPLGVGFRAAPLTLTVSPNGRELSGSWFNALDDSEVPITITRID